MKITPSNEGAQTEDELPDLTPQQSKFVQGLLAGKNASDAYRDAYNASKSASATIWAAASRLRANSKVEAWLRAARIAHLGTHTVTLANHLGELERLREMAIKTGNYGAAFQCEQARGKASGHYIEQYADVTYDPLRTLKTIAEHEPELARKLAEKHNIPLENLETPETRH